MEQALVLETLFLTEDVYSQAEIAEAVEATDLKEPELQLARQIIEGLSGQFDPTTLASDYRRDLKALLEAKLRGEEIAVPEPAPDKAPAVDLLAALKASVEAAKSSSGDAGPAKAKRKPAAKKRAAGTAKPS